VARSSGAPRRSVYQAFLDARAAGSERG
jgi:hypothetical protein